MTANQPVSHPYMANSLPEVKQAMLDAIGAGSIEELFEQIPADHRLKTPIDLPPGLRSEVTLHRELRDALSKNETCEQNLNFLGAGTWQHYVPGPCDAMIRRTEWLTSVFGSPSSDHGRNQAWFEFCSQLGELVGMDMVGLPVYSWGCAIGHAIRMAARITGRSEVLVPANICPERLAVIRTYCEPAEMASHIAVRLVAYDPASGRIDRNDLAAQLSDKTAAIYYENPAYLGMFENGGDEIAKLARAAGAETIVGVDPISLGIIAAPADYGADIAVGSIQPLGVHMNTGGGTGGFIATRDEERYAREYPTLMISVTETSQPGELGFGLSLFHQTSYGMREEGKDWTGNSVYLWAIAGAVYMALAGPQGMRDVGGLILQRARYAAGKLADLPGVSLQFSGDFFKEFTVNFDGTGKSVAEINNLLRAYKIFGGKDLSTEQPELGQSALYCVTEIHTVEDIDRLAEALKEVLS